ncbi:restriction endonuclease subunit S [Enterobacter sp. 302C9]|uniref:restriction endonuclease subunit S n=1 Tax=Enterobacter sp. 302C9 TaxID=3077766 RepID=UPI002A8126BD|nr:restriction endonuclease subunit S [Enterobacter sp. 302C9]
MAGLKEYKPYEHYEDAYAVWYKKKPAHWKCEKFKYYFSEKAKKNAAHLKAGAISFGEVTYKDENNLSIDTKNSYQEVLAGEFVINPLNLNFDLKSLRTALSKINVVVSTGYIILRINGLLNPHYSRWLLHQFDVSHMKTLGSGVRQTISYNDIGNSFFCRPSLEEQTKIAMFLDHKILKIDSLIQKQQNLIELLKEKRQTVISHAVTKGLNLDVPMKDSGVEWLGYMPSHWHVSKIKWIICLKSGESITSNEIASDGNYPVYGGNGLRGFYKEYTHDGNYVIIGRQGAHCGNVQYANNKFWASEHAIVATPTFKYKIAWLGELFRAMNLNQYSVSAAQPGLAVENISDLKIPIPPYPEQKKLAKYIENHISINDKLIKNSLNCIKLLKERRTALIAAAVTGKIDLRDWTPPASSTETSLTAEEATA